MGEHHHEHADQGQQSHHHDGHGHSHGVAADADRRYLSIALGLLLAFMAGEVAAAVVSHSLALVADAAHMLTDAGAIGLSLVALVEIRIRRPPWPETKPRHVGDRAPSR